MKAKSVLLYLSIISYLLAIAEHVLNLGLLNWLYSTVNQTTVFYLLVIIGTAFIVTYLIESIRKPKGFLSFGNIRQRPLGIDVYNPYVGNDYGVKWHLYPPEPLSMDKQPWADGPYCPRCARELETETKEHIFKREVWRCPICDVEYSKPNGDVKDIVEKNFAAYLRKKGEL